MRQAVKDTISLANWVMGAFVVAILALAGLAVHVFYEAVVFSSVSIALMGLVLIGLTVALLLGIRSIHKKKMDFIRDVGITG